MAAKPTVKGFTLVEVLVFITILSGVFVTTLAIATQALRVSKTAEHRTLASHYADELSEWMLSESEQDWDAFVANRAPTATNLYCFNQEPIGSWPSTSGACTAYTLNTIYKRDVVLTKTSIGSGQYQVQADITVTWTEGSNTFTVPVSILMNNSGL